MINQLETLLAANLTPGSVWREYELIQLARRELREFPQQSLSDPYYLFQCHFLLRHCLYRLRNRWRESHQGELILTALSIECTHWIPGTIGLQLYDRVAEFYVDLNNLTRLDRDDITLLLNGFWDRYAARQAKSDLCRLLELDPDSADERIQRAWRQSTQRLHPDKGGDIERFKQVQSAYDSWRRPRFAAL